MAKQTQQPEPQVTVHRSERILAYMVAAVIGVSIACLVIMIVAWLTIDRIPDTTFWGTVSVMPFFGFALGILLIIALLMTSWTRRARENRDGPR